LEDIENMGFINPAVAEEAREELEPVTYMTVQELLRDIGRPKELGRLGVMPYQKDSKVVIGRWSRPLGKDLMISPLEGEEHTESVRILEELQVIFMHNGMVFYKNDDCPQHHRPLGSGDCYCESR
jgi:hypothetical protein